jgi:hypothetical protein
MTDLMDVHEPQDTPFWKEAYLRDLKRGSLTGTCRWTNTRTWKFLSCGRRKESKGASRKAHRFQKAHSLFSIGAVPQKIGEEDVSAGNKTLVTVHGKVRWHSHGTI